MMLYTPQVDSTLLMYCSIIVHGGFHSAVATDPIVVAMVPFMMGNLMAKILKRCRIRQ